MKSLNVSIFEKKAILFKQHNKTEFHFLESFTCKFEKAKSIEVFNFFILYFMSIFANKLPTD